MDQDNAPDSTSIDIDDVIAVIEKTDPSTASAMFTNGGDTNAHHQMNTHQQHQQQSAQNSTINSISNLRRNAVVKITEQPASKALRFRYECEGRSAGSIPGVRSTPENKTYPGIQVVGYKGRAVVVVSCVTKDPPYRPHPHNLVGKDGCKKGVCTVEINSSNMSVTFSNLGIQCVKKKDIEDALKMREEIRVDPFRTGFAHKNQQSSIDLNAVRLCFQVFLEGEQRGRFTVPLAPVVSDPIYDKKAMSDLVICKLSDCSCPVAGGKEIILLCEKVAKEDIAVRFYEEHDGDVSWEANGDFQHTNVHKQVAIAFKTPRYKSLEIEQPIQVWIQLRRPSDGATSEPLRFDYLPLDSGRRRFSALRNEILRKQLAFENENFVKQFAKLEEQTIVQPETPVPIENTEIIVLDTPNVEEKPIVPTDEVLSSDIKTNEWIRTNEFFEINNNHIIVDRNDNNLINGVMSPENTTMDTKDDEDKTLNELLEQVAELDEIYTDHQVRRENMIIENELKNFESSVPIATGFNGEKMEIDEIFDDAATYTSLQRAFKNPMSISLGPPVPDRHHHLHIPQPDSNVYDAVEIGPGIIINPPTPLIDASSLKRENNEEKLPPLPPKRAKSSSQAVNNKENKAADNEEHILATIIRRDSNRSLTPRPQSQIIIMKSEDPTNKKLPPTPPASPKKIDSSTLPRQKKPGFFSKLFSRRKSKIDLNESTSSLGKSPEREPASPEPIVDDIVPDSLVSKGSVKLIVNSNKILDSELLGHKPLGRSASSVSGKRPHSDNPDIIYIPLKGDSMNSLPTRGSTTQLAQKSSPSLKRGGSSASLRPIDKKTMSALQLAALPLTDGDKELVAIADAQSIKNLCEGDFGVKLDPNVDLTEAEHFALYTSIAPCATESEFDETSCYYGHIDPNDPFLQEDSAKKIKLIN